MSTPNQPKGERAKVVDAWTYSHGARFWAGYKVEIPCRSRQSARQMAKVGAFWQMSEEEQVEALIHVIEFEPTNELMAKAVLARIQQGARP